MQGGVAATSEVFIPAALCHWACGSESKTLCAEVCEKTGADRIHHVQHCPGKAVFVVSGENGRIVSKARELLRLHLSFQVDVQQNETEKHTVEKEVNRTKQELSDGLRDEFHVDPDLMGLVLGRSDASNIHRIKETTGVDRIVVEPDCGIVRIKGPTKESVTQAREALEYQTVAVDLTHEQALSLDPKSTASIISKTHVRTFSIEGGGRKKIVRIVGTKTAVEAAKAHLDATLMYKSRVKQQQSEISHLRSELNTIKLEYGDAQSKRGRRQQFISQHRQNSGNRASGRVSVNDFGTKKVAHSPAGRGENHGQRGRNNRGRGRNDQGNRGLGRGTVPRQYETNDFRSNRRDRGGYSQLSSRPPSRSGQRRTHSITSTRSNPNDKNVAKTNKQVHRGVHNHSQQVGAETRGSSNILQRELSARTAKSKSASRLVAGALPQNLQNKVAPGRMDVSSATQFKSSAAKAPNPPHSTAKHAQKKPQGQRKSIGNKTTGRGGKHKASGNKSSRQTKDEEGTKAKTSSVNFASGGEVGNATGSKIYGPIYKKGEGSKKPGESAHIKGVKGNGVKSGTSNIRKKKVSSTKQSRENTQVGADQNVAAKKANSKGTAKNNVAAKSAGSTTSNNDNNAPKPQRKSRAAKRKQSGQPPQPAGQST